MLVEPVVPPCRTTVPADAPAVGWIGPFDANQRATLRAWCESIGPIARHDPQIAPASPTQSLTIVSWNIGVGAGSLVKLDKTLRLSGAEGSPHLVLLIQEAYRTSREVPSACPARSGVANRINPARRPDGGDIMQVAQRLALYAVYVPSMRNGTDCEEAPQEDRGNAILSTLPLADVVAIELPFSQQRRVGVAAVVTYGSRRLLVASVHFDTILGHGRQAQGLTQAIAMLGPADAIVVGGDFNSHLFDRGVKQMRKHFTRLPCGTGPTHITGRLDHLFVQGLKSETRCEVGSDRFGSDHNPLIATAQLAR